MHPYIESTEDYIYDNAIIFCLKDLVLGFKGQEVPNEMLDIAKGLPYVDFQTVGVLVNKIKLKRGNL